LIYIFKKKDNNLIQKSGWIFNLLLDRGGKLIGIMVYAGVYLMMLIVIISMIVRYRLKKCGG